MSAPCFPYGFPTDYARSLSRVDRSGLDALIPIPPPSAMNAGMSAAFVGTNAGGFQACFCADCKVSGSSTAVRLPTPGALEMIRQASSSRAKRASCRSNARR